MLLSQSDYSRGGTTITTTSGGTADQQAAVEKDLDVIFDTPRGRQMANTLDSSGRVVDVRLNNRGNLSAPTPGNHVNIDPSAHPVIQVRRQFLFFHWNGTQAASTTRIIAHELGHAVFGTPDAGLQNVLLNENAIVNSYSSPVGRFFGFGDFPRIAY